MSDENFTANALEERGYFWWADEPIPAGFYAPKTHVSGNLVISNSGRITLQLDGIMRGRDLNDAFNTHATSRR